MAIYHIIGLMSGTSLDGLDIALCRFETSQVNVQSPETGICFSLLHAATVPYPDEWQHRLARLPQASALDYALADVELGKWMGLQVANFVSQLPFEPPHEMVVASHGHTIFHQPQSGLTAQIGKGDCIAAACGLPVVCDFRSLDVALGGQGAPLVPIGDQLLFGNYDACLNLGGFSNISFRCGLAFDISPCNIVLNSLAYQLGYDYDPDGSLAKQGQIIDPLLPALNKLPFYRQAAPKSLGREWVDQLFMPVVQQFSTYDTHSLLRTVTEHIATQIAHAISTHRTTPQPIQLLATGGGALNQFLIERIKSLSASTHVTIPDTNVINYKEAIIFALLGLLRLIGQPNCLKRVTGAQTDCCGGHLISR
ncbi:MAG: anhydro-N-acetylmuramic acid kinase [Bacteroidales bacterium]|nr:anhydro-N-acetylmuramic acid kinase [Candidatus Colimorpha onthohippi]